MMFDMSALVEFVNYGRWMEIKAFEKTLAGSNIHLHRFSLGLQNEDSDALLVTILVHYYERIGQTGCWNIQRQNVSSSVRTSAFVSTSLSVLILNGNVWITKHDLNPKSVSWYICACCRHLWRWAGLCSLTAGGPERWAGPGQWNYSSPVIIDQALGLQPNAGGSTPPRQTSTIQKHKPVILAV